MVVAVKRTLDLSRDMARESPRDQSYHSTLLRLSFLVCNIEVITVSVS